MKYQKILLSTFIFAAFAHFSLRGEISFSSLDTYVLLLRAKSYLVHHEAIKDAAVGVAEALKSLAELSTTTPPIRFTTFNHRLATLNTSFQETLTSSPEMSSQTFARLLHHHATFVTWYATYKKKLSTKAAALPEESQQKIECFLKHADSFIKNLTILTDPALMTFLSKKTLGRTVKSKKVLRTLGALIIVVALYSAYTLRQKGAFLADDPDLERIRRLFPAENPSSYAGGGAAPHRNESLPSSAPILTPFTQSLKNFMNTFCSFYEPLVDKDTQSLLAKERFISNKLTIILSALPTPDHAAVGLGYFVLRTAYELPLNKCNTHKDHEIFSLERCDKCQKVNDPTVHNNTDKIKERTVLLTAASQLFEIHMLEQKLLKSLEIAINKRKGEKFIKGLHDRIIPYTKVLNGDIALSSTLEKFCKGKASPEEINQKFNLYLTIKSAATATCIALETEQPPQTEHLPRLKEPSKEEDNQEQAASHESENNDNCPICFEKLADTTLITSFKCDYRHFMCNVCLEDLKRVKEGNKEKAHCYACTAPLEESPPQTYQSFKDYLAEKAKK